MAKNVSHHSHLNSSSMVDLKAELFRKQEEYKKRQIRAKNGEYVKGKVEDSTLKKKPNIWSKQNKGVLERAQRDFVEKVEEEDINDKSRKALEAKARLYDKISNSSEIPDEDGSGTYLVDFQRKVLDSKFEKREDELRDSPPPQHSDEEWVDYEDSLGRSRRCLQKDLPALMEQDRKLSGSKSKQTEKEEVLPSLLSNDMYREIQRKKWEEEEEAKLKEPVGPIHYANVQHNEIRTHGVGFYQFSKTEEQRQEQMETLNQLRDETVNARAKIDRLKEKRKAQLEARLAKVKQRRKMKEGYEEEKEEKKEDEIGPKIEDMLSQQRAIVEEQELPVKAKPIREWDKDKEKMFRWSEENYLQERRDERDREFAPPSIYKDIAKPGPKYKTLKHTASTSKNVYNSDASVAEKNSLPRIFLQNKMPTATKISPKVNPNETKVQRTEFNPCNLPSSLGNSGKTSNQTTFSLPSEFNPSILPPTSQSNSSENSKPTFHLPFEFNSNIPPPSGNSSLNKHNQTISLPPGFNPNIPPPPPPPLENSSFDKSSDICQGIPTSHSQSVNSGSATHNVYAPPSASFLSQNCQNMTQSFPSQNYQNMTMSFPSQNYQNMTQCSQNSNSTVNIASVQNLADYQNSYNFTPETKTVPKENIVDTRLVRKIDGLDEMDQSGNVDSTCNAVPYKPGTFYLQKLAQDKLKQGEFQTSVSDESSVMSSTNIASETD